MNDIVIMIFSMTLLLLVGLAVGYAFATRSSLMAIANEDLELGYESVFQFERRIKKFNGD